MHLDCNWGADGRKSSAVMPMQQTPVCGWARPTDIWGVCLAQPTGGSNEPQMENAMNADFSFSGMNAREALRIARELSCTIYVPRRTGEIVVTHPLIPLRVRISCRRKDAPRSLTTYLQRLMRTQANGN